MRLFVAIELDDVVKRMMLNVRRSLDGFSEQVRWVGAEQMHLTLKFLGEAMDNRVPEICEALETAASSSTSFELTLDGAGCFPPRGRVRVIWLDATDLAGLLCDCQQAVEKQLARIGFEPANRPFSSHLTLGRVKNDTTSGALREAVKNLETESVSQPVDSIALIQSQLSPHGAKHTRLGVWPLDGGGAKHESTNMGERHGHTARR